MVFKRFFDRGNDAAPPAAEPVPADDELPADPESLDDAAAPEDADEHPWAARALAVIPGGASTGSKRPEALYGAADTDLPTHFLRAAGCHVVAADGETYVDCTMALGAVALGYAEPAVTHAVMEAAGAGNVSGLSSVLEVSVAERLCGVIPCAEQVRFLKSGAEALSAAVRIARTYTGRDHVVASGYFGWHDWAGDAAGIPQGVRKDVTHVPFDDVAALEQAVRGAGGALAAIVIEPVVERMPSDAWVARARELATQAGAVLIFDEMKTGFRLATGGFQQVSGVTPDLAAFGKALANGYPLAAVCGRKDVMDAARRTWISSTLGGEATALAAASAVLDWHQQAEVCEALQHNGADMRNVVQAAMVASGIGGVSMLGLDQMWMLRFDDPAIENAFIARAMRHGVLFKRGAYNYASVAHDDEAIQAIERAASAAFVELMEEGIAR
ncbi:MAG TPA: aminotransferase class III-fold pyridoxal phosphate-dependent enzyme [Gemmatimonadaceae bacterium]|nr:aminotransferase class III-fold pyridoxal phosphate-dependent enzyme [Gemmatimonadaceae bacterium]